MLRPERMTPTSIICVKKDVESALEALNSFGEFHIDHSINEEKSLAENSQNIQKAQDAFSDAISLTKQLVTEKSSLLAMFKVSEPAKIPVTAENWQTLLDSTSENISILKKENDELNSKLENLQEKTSQLNHVKDMLSRMELMRIDLAVVEELKLIYVAVASVPAKNFDALETALASLPIYVNHSTLSKEKIFAILATPSKHRTDVDRLIKTYHAEIFRIPENLPKNIEMALKEVNNLLRDNQEKEKQVYDSIKKLGETNKENLASWTEISENLLSIFNAETKILQSGRIVTLKGFVPTKRLGELNSRVTDTLEGKAIVIPNEELEARQPPTRILNNRFIKPFEELTRLYGLPKYDEIDPTPVIAITFPILFGLMFGDVGHGLVLLVGGLALGMLIKTNQSMKNVCFVMAACGIGAIVAGLLFGEFFGIALPWGPLWFSPFDNVFQFLIFSLFVGIAQIVSGIVLEMVNFSIRRNIADALLTSLPKIAFYIGGVYLIVIYQLNFGAWLAGPILFAIVPFIILVVGKPLYLVAAKPKNYTKGEHAEMDTLSGRLFEGGDLLTRLLSNTISYSRILALLMAHWALILVTYTIAGLVGTSNILAVILSGVIIVGGNIFVLALEGLIVFIHTLRLHFYEWFSKFYAGTGIEFHPFKQNFRHTNLTLKRNEKLDNQ
jgi:V/A-type H+-transporting ATPase subunit I